MKSKLHFVDICAEHLAFVSLLNEETKVHTPVASIKTARFCRVEKNRNQTMSDEKSCLKVYESEFEEF